MSHANFVTTWNIFSRLKKIDDVEAKKMRLIECA